MLAVSLNSHDLLRVPPEALVDRDLFLEDALFTADSIQLLKAAVLVSVP